VKDKRILIGIVTRNRAKILPKAISSALAQDATNSSLVVLDDGSSDSTPQLKGDYPAVQWIRWEQNQGYIEARNFLMRSAGEKYFVSLDDDAWFVNGDEVATAAKDLEENESFAAVAFDILSPDRSQASPRGAARPVSMFIGCGHMIRLDRVREVGFYENSPGTYGGEEKDLCLRLIDAGYEIVLLPGVHVFHDKTSIERHTPTQHQSGVSNDLAMTFRRTPLLILPAAIISKCYRHLAFSLKNGLTAACLAGFLDFLQSIPKLCRSRKPVRAATLRKFINLRRTQGAVQTA
jgi:GT2 family glycosyltransferase